MRCSTRLAAALLVGLTVLAAPALAAGEGDAPDGASPKPPLSVFIGRLLSIEALDVNCGQDCAPFDSGYALVYQPLKPMQGMPVPSPVRVQFFGHYGLPSFARFDTALLFVFRGERDDTLARYLGFPVAETADGRWAHCGDTQDEDAPPRDRRLARFAFAHKVKTTDAVVPEQDDGHRFSSRDPMRPGIRHCAAGMDAEDLARLHAPRAEPGYLRVWRF